LLLVKLFKPNYLYKYIEYILLSAKQAEHKIYMPDI